ncbi:MAG: hypothetical protein ACK50I_21285 [Burkholderiales bacterium]
MPGTGMMGASTARWLCEACHEVHARSRTRAKAEPAGRVRRARARCSARGGGAVGPDGFEAGERADDRGRAVRSGLGHPGRRQGVDPARRGVRHVTRLAALGLVAHVGPYGAGQLAESSPNPMIVGITIGAVPEALPLCETGGADPAKVREAISGGFADSRVLQVRGQ